MNQCVYSEVGRAASELGDPHWGGSGLLIRIPLRRVIPLVMRRNIVGAGDTSGLWFFGLFFVVILSRNSWAVWVGGRAKRTCGISFAVVARFSVWIRFNSTPTQQLGLYGDWLNSVVELDQSIKDWRDVDILLDRCAMVFRELNNTIHFYTELWQMLAVWAFISSSHWEFHRDCGKKKPILIFWVGR